MPHAFLYESFGLAALESVDHFGTRVHCRMSTMFIGERGDMQPARRNALTLPSPVAGASTRPGVGLVHFLGRRVIPRVRTKTTITFVRRMLETGCTLILFLLLLQLGPLVRFVLTAFTTGFSVELVGWTVSSAEVGVV